MTAADETGRQLAAYVGRAYGPYRAWDAVNAPMIRQWREAVSAGNDDATADPDFAPGVEAIEGRISEVVEVEQDNGRRPRVIGRLISVPSNRELLQRRL